MEDKISIIIVDDSKVIRDYVKYALERNNEFLILAVCINGYEAIDAAQKFKPNIMLMDIEMEPINGYETTYAIKQKIPEIKIIAYSTHNASIHVRNFLEKGGDGYITKSTPVKELYFGIQQVKKGVRYLCKEVQSEENEVVK